MIKYRVNGEYLDQFDNAKDFAVTKQISKIGEIDLRHGDYSTGFKVPLTANNARILRYVSELNSYSTNSNTLGINPLDTNPSGRNIFSQTLTTENPDKFDRFNGQLVQDDVVISDGYYQVKGFNPIKKEIDVRFFGGNSDWFDLLVNNHQFLISIHFVAP
jgi:hypothetical protein